MSLIWNYDDRSFDHPVYTAVVKHDEVVNLVKKFRFRRVNCPRPRMSVRDIEAYVVVDAGFEGGRKPNYISVLYQGDGNWCVSVAAGGKHLTVMSAIDNGLRSNRR